MSLNGFVTRRVEDEGMVGVGEFVFAKDCHVFHNKYFDAREPLCQQRGIAVLGTVRQPHGRMLHAASYAKVGIPTSMGKGLRNAVWNPEQCIDRDGADAYLILVDKRTL